MEKHTLNKSHGKHFRASNKAINPSVIRIARHLLIVILFLRPLISSFFGADIGDTGLHYTNFKYLYSRPDIVGYSSLLSSIVGNLWLRFFGWLGIWGLNFLEVIVEWLTSLLVYRWMTRRYDKNVVLSGMVIASVLGGTYLNVFNYHQFSVLLVTCFLYCLYCAIVQDSPLWSAIAAIVLMAAIAARVVNIVCISAFILFFYSSNECTKSTKQSSHIIALLVGFIISALIIAFFFVFSGLGIAFLKSMGRLGNMASSSSGSYSITTLLRILVGGIIKSLASPLLLCAAALFLLLFLKLVSRKDLLNIVLAFFCLVAVPILVKFSYNVNPVDGSPQLSTGPNFFTGILFFAAIIRAVQTFDNREDFLLTAMAALLAIYSLAGSNTGTKHIVISMWMLGPIVVYEIIHLWQWMMNEARNRKIDLKKYEASIITLFFAVALIYKMGTFLRVTNNFDSTNRLELTEPLVSRNYSLLRTTKREADALNGLTEAYGDGRDERLIVFGSGLGIYPLLDAEPFSRAWVTDPSFSSEQFREDLYSAESCPPIVYCRTNQYFGFNSWKYGEQIDQIMNTGFSGKKKVLVLYLIDRGYRLTYQNDYYFLFEQSLSGEALTEDYLTILLGKQ